MTQNAAAAFAQAAASFVGMQFRLGGRDPAVGLDCVGLVLASLHGAGRAGADIRGYSLRNLSIDRWVPLAAQCGFISANGPAMTGDLHCCQPGPGQQHLVIWQTPDRFIHAHAGLRRVVVTPAPIPWPIMHHWRLLS